MSMDRSLKSSGGLVRHRNVLSRVERIAVLEDAGRFSADQDSIFGLPKVVHRKSTAGKKEKKEKAAEGDAAAAAAAPAAQPKA